MRDATMLPVKPFVLLGTVVCLAIAATGCGSSSSSTSSTAASAAAATGTTPAPGSTTTAPVGGEGGSTRSNAGSGDSNAGSADSSAGSGNATARSGGGETNDNGAPLGSDTSKRGDNSIESYGSDVQGAEKAAAVSAMHSFDLAVASRDYAGVCSGLSGRIRAGLVQPGKTCPELLESILIIRPSVARGSANGVVTHVRVGGGNAFVLFRPPGGSQLDYFAMKLEDGKWKALGLTVGTPVNPTVAPGQ